MFSICHADELLSPEVCMNQMEVGVDTVNDVSNECVTLIPCET
jgi:hypothetical protein